MQYYNETFAGGKWNHFMDQVHIGYTIWQDPKQNVMPRVTKIELPQAATLGLSVEGSASSWPDSTGNPVLPQIDCFNRQRRYIDVFNRDAESFRFTAASSAPWILLSASQGIIERKSASGLISIGAKRLKATEMQLVNISRQGGESVDINVPVFNPTEITRASLSGFVESDGLRIHRGRALYKNIPAGQVRWDRIQDYGRTLSAMTIVPMTARSVTPPKHSPSLEYRMYLFNPQKVTVHATVAPTLNFAPERGLRYAISFDDQPPQVVTVVPKGFDARNGNREWEESVRNACRVVQSTHTLSGRGYHTLKVWMVDPAVVLQKIVVDLGD